MKPRIRVTLQICRQLCSSGRKRAGGGRVAYTHLNIHTYIHTQINICIHIHIDRYRVRKFYVDVS